MQHSNNILFLTWNIICAMVCRTNKPDLLWCLVFLPSSCNVGFLRLLLFRNMWTEYFHTLSLCGSLTSPPALWEEQRAVPDTLCQGLKHGQPETSRRPQCEAERMGESEQLCVTRRRGGGKARPHQTSCIQVSGSQNSGERRPDWTHQTNNSSQIK